MQNLLHQRTFRALLRHFLLSVASLAILMALLCSLIVVQGQRDDERPVGAAIVIGAAQWDTLSASSLHARLDHVLELYKRGYVNRIILTSGPHQLDNSTETDIGQHYLLEHGLPPTALLLAPQGTTDWQSIQNAITLARTSGIGTALLVSDPPRMLRSLKMARDLGFNAYASPARDTATSNTRIATARQIVGEAWAYLGYILLRT